MHFNENECPLVIKWANLFTSSREPSCKSNTAED